MMKTFKAKMTWCPSCSTTNAPDAKTCIRCKSTGLSSLPSTAKSLAKLFKALEAYIEVAEIAYSKFIVDNEITEETEHYLFAMVMNYILALELGIKAEILMNAKEFPKTHKITELFKLLENERKDDVEKAFEHFNQMRNDFKFAKYLKQLDPLFTNLRYLHFETLISSGRTNFDIEFLREMAKYFSKPQTVYCFTLYCRKSEAERDCENCEYLDHEGGFIKCKA